MLKLLDLIELAGVDLGNFKVHFATGHDPTPLEVFFDDGFQEWQEHQNQQNFKCDKILSLISISGDKWLFAGVFRVDGVKPISTGAKSKYAGHFRYSTSKEPGLDDLTGRAIVRFEKKFRASYLRGMKYGNELLVSEIRGQRMSVGDFPGYNSVLLSHRLLGTVVREEIASWKGALASVAGVYLIVDRTDGRQYVGSASGSGGLWGRWTAYVKSSHAGNKELKELLSKKGSEHVNHFQYSILEVCDLTASSETVLQREAHWKNVLRSREFGLNSN